jgi:hypothetical protein
VEHSASVRVPSRDRACRVDAERACALAGAGPRARSVECGDTAVRSAQETVKHVASVRVASRDCPCRVDGERGCALAGTCTRARSIECGDGRLRVNKWRVVEIPEAITRAAGGSGREDTQEQDRGYGGS